MLVCEGPNSWFLPLFYGFIRTHVKLLNIKVHLQEMGQDLSTSFISGGLFSFFSLRP